MARISIYRVPISKVSQKVHYLENEEKSGIWQSTYNLKEPIKDFLEQAERFHEKQAAYHIIQSFSHKDPIDPKITHKMGKDLIDSCFKNHQVMWSTHSNTPFLHNHILVSSRDLNGIALEPDLRKLTRTIEKQNEVIARNYGCEIEKEKYKTVSITSYNKELIEDKEPTLKSRYLQDLQLARKGCVDLSELYKFMNQKGYQFLESKNGNLSISDGTTILPEKSLNAYDQINSLEIFFEKKCQRPYELIQIIPSSTNTFSQREEEVCLQLFDQVSDKPFLTKEEINKRYELVLNINSKCDQIEYLNHKDYQNEKELFLDRRNKEQWKSSIEEQYINCKKVYIELRKSNPKSPVLPGLRNETNRLFFILAHIKADLNRIEKVIEDQELIEPLYLKETYDLNEIENQDITRIALEKSKQDAPDDLEYFLEEITDLEVMSLEGPFERGMIENREMLEILELL